MKKQIGRNGGRAPLAMRASGLFGSVDLGTP
jgi:hypothetical protein